MPITIDSSVPYLLRPAGQPGSAISVNQMFEGTLTDESPGLRALVFYITPSPYQAATKKICTTYLEGQYCLDQWGNNVTQVAFQQEGYFSGQEWTLSISSGDANGETLWKLQSDFAGPSRYLATEGTNLIMSSNAPEDTAEWEIVDAIQNSVVTVVVTPTPTLSSTSSTMTTVATTSTSGLPSSTSDQAASLTPVSLTRGLIVCTYLCILSLVSPLFMFPG